jgi:hypothetical protein
MSGNWVQDEPPTDLARAGAVVDKAIGYMVGERIDGMVIASALLGGALEMLANSMDDASIVQVLESAIASVRAGDLRADAGEH